MNLKEKIKALLGCKEDLRAAITKIKELPDEGAEKQELFSAFKTAFLEAVDETDAGENKDSLELACKEFIAGNLESFSIDQPVLFQDAQEIVTELLDGLTEDVAKAIFTLYAECGGKILELDENLPLTFGQLYGLESEDPLYSVEAPMSTTKRKSLPDSVFCGPNRSFPVNDKPHAVAALRLLGRYKGPGDKAAIRACILRKGAKFGVGAKKEEAVVLFPMYVQGKETQEPINQFPISTEEELNSLRQNFDYISEEYNLSTEQKEAFAKNLDNFEKILPYITIESDSFDPLPLFAIEDEGINAIRLGDDFLYDHFVKSTETGQTDYLRSLVGVVRKLELSQQEVTEASKSYSVFSPTILQRLLSAIPEKKEIETIEQHLEPEIPLAVEPTSTEEKSEQMEVSTVFEANQRLRSQKPMKKGATNSKEYKI